MITRWKRSASTARITGLFVIFTLASFSTSEVSPSDLLKESNLENLLKDAGMPADPLELQKDLKEAERQLFDLNPNKLRQLWHHGMVKSLLKSKAKAICRNLPYVEQVVYKQCEADAKSLVQLARCVVRLLNERDRLKAEAEELELRRKVEEESQLALQRQHEEFNEAILRSNLFFRSQLPTPMEPLNPDGLSMNKVYQTSATIEAPRPFMSISEFDYPPVPRKSPRRRFNPIRSQLRTKWIMRQMKRWKHRDGVIIVDGDHTLDDQSSLHQGSIQQPLKLREETYRNIVDQSSLQLGSYPESGQRFREQTPFSDSDRSVVDRSSLLQGTSFDISMERQMQQGHVGDGSRLHDGQTLTPREWNLWKAARMHYGGTSPEEFRRLRVWRRRRSTILSIDDAYEQFQREENRRQLPVFGGAPPGHSPIQPPQLQPITGQAVKEPQGFIPEPVMPAVTSSGSFGIRGRKDSDPLAGIVTEVLGKAAIQPVNTIHPVVNEMQPIIPASRIEQEPVSVQSVQERRPVAMSVRILEVKPSMMNHTNKILSLPSRNLIGLPRYMTLRDQQDKRMKRNVPTNEETPSAALGTSPNLSLPNLAAKYFNFLGNRFLVNPSTHSGESSMNSNSAKLAAIQEHFARVQKCNKYFKLMSNENKGIFKQLGLPVDVHSPHVSASQEETILKGVLEMVNDFAASHNVDDGRSAASTRWSVLSPRLFSLFPNGKGDGDGMASKGKLLSPSLLSFQNDGMFSLPQIFNMLTSDESSQRVMLDVIMDLSGASSALDQAMVNLQPEMKHTAEVQYPLVQTLSKLDHAWLQLKKSYSPSQQASIEQNGYAFLEPEQMRKVYGDEVSSLKLNLDEYSTMTEDQREARVEADIRSLADVGKARMGINRKKRSTMQELIKQNQTIVEDSQSDRKWYEKPNTVTVGVRGHVKVQGDDVIRIDESRTVVEVGNTTVIPTTTTTNVFSFVTQTKNPLVDFQDPVTTTTSSTSSTTTSSTNKHELDSVEAIIRDEEEERGNTTTDTNHHHAHADTGHVTEGGTGGHAEERHEGIEFKTLEPMAFTNLIGHGAALEAVTLSPQAFIGEILSPEALILSTLSPRAFIATVLSPAALVARILSPTAFRAESERSSFNLIDNRSVENREVLAPRALYTWVLSPEALIAEVLTPHFLEPRVLSPEALIIDILSPRFISPNVLSPEAFGVIVLSPNVLSPRIASEEKYLVEVLSPHILGGPHSKEEEEEHVLSIGGHKEHEGEHKGGPNHPAHGPEAAWDLTGGHAHHDGGGPHIEHYVAHQQLLV